MEQLKKRALFLLPFYNEENRMETGQFEKAFSENPLIHFLLIDDCSSDNTLTILKNFSSKYKNVSVLLNDENVGKAETIRRGVMESDMSLYENIGYMDADLATPFSEMMRLLSFRDRHPEMEFVMGARIKLLGNNVKRSLTRHYFGRIFATIISQIILKIPVYDTQCGAKVINADLADKLFKEPFTTKWLFDVELLLRFKKTDLQFDKKVTEIPLDNWAEKKNSKIRFYEFLLFPFQIVKIYFKYV